MDITDDIPPPPPLSPPPVESTLSVTSSTEQQAPPPPPPPLSSSNGEDYDEEGEKNASSSSKQQGSTASIATYIQHGHTIVPLRKRPIFLRLDVFPFAILYCTYVYCDWKGEYYEYTNILFPMTLLIHLSVFLTQCWKVSVRSKVGYRKASRSKKKIGNWTHVLVTPPNNCGMSDIVPLQKRKFSSPKDGELSSVSEFMFQDVIFRKGSYFPDLWDGLSSNKDNGEDKESSNKKASCDFKRLHFPTDWPLSSYISKWKGHTTNTSLQASFQTYGRNLCQISIPSLWVLLGEQLVAPFFLFQVFCVALWSLDEYWYYAIFTLFTLFLFEMTAALNRRRSLKRLRETTRPSYPVLCYRFQQWDWIRSDELVAGDILSLKSTHISEASSEQQNQLPCDVLLLTGSAVLNEAMLTGESVPQLKEAVESTISGGGIQPSSAAAKEQDKDSSSSSDKKSSKQYDAGSTILDMDDMLHKKSILFGGTTVLDAHPPSSDSSTSTSSSCVPSPPDGGCTGFVLRTGFETQQGHLLRTMIHSSRHAKDGVNTKDTFIFILLLLCCALFSATYVLLDGWFNETRNRFRLILHVIIILTSVVPPELPMELSLAVTSSLQDLMMSQIFCTEPFRIPLGGKVDTCAFDKTGTLTSDEMRVKGLRLPPPLPKTTIGIILTREQREIRCLDGESKHGSNADLVVPSEVPRDTLRVMVGCQALARDRNNNVNNNSSLIGDPLEKAVLKACEWTVQRNNATVVPAPHNSSKYANASPITILHRFAFESRLKRMTTLVQEGNQKNLLVLTKGAPEVIKPMLTAASTPPNYDIVYRHHMSMGQRVLCLAYKDLGSNPPSVQSLRSRGRRYVESNLIFCGFLVLDCPLKPDSSRIMNELKASGHSCVMITGDAALTACEVARQVGIIDTAPGDTYDLREMTRVHYTDKGKGKEQVMEVDQSFAFVPIDKAPGQYKPEECIAFVPGNIKVLMNMMKQNELSLCVTGEALTKVAVSAVRRQYFLTMQERYTKKKNIPPPPPIDPKTVLLDPAAQAVLKMLVPCVSVFARHAPRQKEAVIAAFNAAGRYTLMCGDGTNDVGALKQAHVGISIISMPEIEAKHRSAKEAIKSAKKEQKSSNKKSSRKSSSKSIEQSLQELAEAQEQLYEVALGDASVASPFTSRTMSIACCKDIIRQGRCTLVIMLTIYKILGVNCLVNALILSELHMHGVKQGDRQLTAVGIIVAGLFFFVTKGKPLKSLSSHRPSSSVLCKQAFASIGSQFLIHMIAILCVTNMALAFLDPDDPSAHVDGPFHPNPLNTCCFLMTVLATINTFAVNYRGKPFMQSFKSNKMLLRSVQVCVGALFLCALEFFEPLNQLLQLAPLPSTHTIGVLNLNDGQKMNPILSIFVNTLGFKMTLLMIMSLDSYASIKTERAIIKYYEKR